MLCELLASPPELSSPWFGYPSSMMAPENERDSSPRKGGRTWAARMHDPQKCNLFTLTHMQQGA
jgi:hypothetical protein